MRIVAILVISLICSELWAQPVIVWQKNYGGLLFDQTFGSALTQDGGLISGGHSRSSDGDLDTNRGDYDWWLLRLDANGTVLRSKSFGGSDYDKCRYAMENPDKTIMAFGSVKSVDGDVVNPLGNNDYWLLKLDSLFNIIWKKNYGGTGDEGGRMVIRTMDGNHLIAGYSYSNDYHAVGNHGLYDVLLIKVNDADGSVIWSKCFGGSNDERVRSIMEMPNGDFVFTGNSASIDGDLAGTINYGSEDVWTARIDSVGNLIWSVQHGSPGKDRAYHLTTDHDGHILVAGKDSVNGGLVTDNHGMSDCWILKLNQNSGNIIWQKSFGGSEEDEGFRIDPNPDGGYTIGASSESEDGDCTYRKKFSDYWIFKTDSDLNILWQRKLGGGSWDHLNEIIRMPDYSYLCVGFSSSKPSGTSDITNNIGNYDCWVARVTFCNPNPKIQWPSTYVLNENDTITLSTGIYEASSFLWSTGDTTPDITVFNPGTYYVTVTNNAYGCVSYSDSVYIAPDNVCLAPSVYEAVEVSESTAKITWNTYNNAMGYNVKYRVNGTSNWTTKWIGINTGQKVLTGLTPGTTYQYRLRTKCQSNPNQFSAWSPKAYFTTGGVRLFNGPVQLSLHPNPAIQHVTVEFALDANKAFLNIFDATGHVAHNEKLISTNGYFKKNIDLAKLNKGIYVVEVFSDVSVYRSKLVIK